MDVNKIVLEHYPVSQLPSDLRQVVGDAEKVTLTIEAEGKAELGCGKNPTAPVRWFEKHKLAHRDNFKSPEEVRAWVRSLREEWSHRER
jgi:hypothetical protein